MAAAVPNCRAYDPAYAFEVAVLVEYGMRRMLDEQRDEFFYLTVTNANLAQPDMPADAGVREGILRGMPDAARSRNGGRPPARTLWRGRRGLERHQLFRAGPRRPRGRARPGAGA
ncbi:hypothetical protein G6F50_016821 [Rhizopus delemar]|uniref:Pyruvate dehydrogenase E1 component middle domain-containing protein n=1 Tax=Rhizopus delemar TaxID=936053 RepID=A0A9P6XRS9_9FUNG|nr:hypothetical protein G6F50_016821 [Rhizopus delemar]